jgi:hypothetical protein
MVRVFDVVGCKVGVLRQCDVVGEYDAIFEMKVLQDTISPMEIGEMDLNTSIPRKAET